MISVCIATYNGEKYLREQVESILGQLGEGDEIVISDDCSSDKTIDVLQALGDARVRILHHDPSQVTTSFPLDKPTQNFENALKHAKGDIIFLADQDDVWLPGKVEKMLAALQDADMAMHDCIVVDSNLQELSPSYFNIISVSTNAWRNLCKCTLLGCCMAMRRCVLEKALPFPKSRVGHDLWLGLVADRKFRFTLVRVPLLKYRKHSSSTTTAGQRSSNSLWFKLRYRMSVLHHLLKLILTR